MVMLKSSVTVLPGAVTRTAVVPVTAVPENVRFNRLVAPAAASSQARRPRELKEAILGGAADCGVVFRKFWQNEAKFANKIKPRALEASSTR
jgi:hypothetical protein